VIATWLSTSYRDFSAEVERIDEMLWEALALEPKSRVLFCGFSQSKTIIERAVANGVRVSLMTTDEREVREARQLGVEVLRGSLLGIPARTEGFYLVVAYHVLHETDPTLHRHIIGEFGRVARRIAIVEPGPPSDLLGSRIASLYARAKRSRGQFEQYQSISYWRELLGRVRSHVVPHEIRFSSIPPKRYLRDGIQLLISSMRVAGAAESDLRDLQGLAENATTQLVPQPRYVLFAGRTPSDIPARPRLAELQRQGAAVTEAARRQPTPVPQPLPRPKPVPIVVESHPSTLLPTPVPVRAATQPTPTPTGPTTLRPRSAPVGDALTDEFADFGLPRDEEESPLAATQSSFQAIFGIPDIPGTTSFDWTD